VPEIFDIDCEFRAPNFILEYTPKSWEFNFGKIQIKTEEYLVGQADDNGNFLGNCFNRYQEKTDYDTFYMILDGGELSQKVTGKPKGDVPRPTKTTNFVRLDK
jgi:hypothetical protein